MKISKKTDRKQAAPDPYALARMLGDIKPLQKNVVFWLGDTVERYKMILAAASIDRPLRQERIDVLLSLAHGALTELHRMGALPAAGLPTDMTPIRAKIMRFINTEIATKQTAPTYREIAKHLGYVSAGAITKHVKKLVADGYLVAGPGSRSIVVTPKGESIR